MKTTTAKRRAPSANGRPGRVSIAKLKGRGRLVPASSPPGLARRGRVVQAPGFKAALNGGRAKLWQLRLYVAGHTPRSLAAFANLKQICETHLKGLYHIEVIDLVAQPQLSKGDQILAIPTLVRKLPVPVRKIIGDLSDTERVLVGLDLRPAN